MAGFLAAGWERWLAVPALVADGGESSEDVRQGIAEKSRQLHRLTFLPAGKWIAPVRWLACCGRRSMVGVSVAAAVVGALRLRETDCGAISSCWF